eukprot:gene5347-6489_t
MEGVLLAGGQAASGGKTKEELGADLIQELRGMQAQIMQTVADLPDEAQEAEEEAARLAKLAAENQVLLKFTHQIESIQNPSSSEAKEMISKFVDRLAIETLEDHTLVTRKYVVAARETELQTMREEERSARLGEMKARAVAERERAAEQMAVQHQLKNASEMQAAQQMVAAAEEQRQAQELAAAHLRAELEAAKQALVTIEKEEDLKKEHKEELMRRSEQRIGDLQSALAVEIQEADQLQTMLKNAEDAAKNAAGLVNERAAVRRGAPMAMMMMGTGGGVLVGFV